MTTRYLFNTSTTKSLSLRYGVGMRNKIQIPPRKGVLLPAALTKGLLASYLNLFKGDLRVVTEIPKEVNNEDAKENEVTNKVPQKEDQTQDGTQSNGDESHDESNNPTGNPSGQDNQTNEGDVENGSNDEGNDAGLGDAQGNGDGQDVGSDQPAGENDGTVQQPTEDNEGNISKFVIDLREDGYYIQSDEVGEGPFATQEDAQARIDEYARAEMEANASNETQGKEVLSEKQLKDMKAEEVKAYAKELGLNFEDDITKKALIAVILSKGE